MKLKHTPLAALLAITITVGANAATVLYSENFNGEGTAGDAYNDGTTPETNVGSIGILQSTGVSQGGNAGDTAWSLNDPGTGERGLRFGNGYNWATGSNATTILLAGGFSVAFDYTVAGDAENWMAVRVGSGGENSAVNATDVTFGALARGDGRMQTFENGAADSFGTATVGATRSARFNYAFTSWAAGTTVTFTGIIDGNTVATDTFTWDAANDMKIVFAGYPGGALVDNIVVSTIPEPRAALLGGLGLLALLRRRRA
jgi:hypothetical protein